MLAFTLVVSVVVGIGFGLVPALAMARQDPAESLRGEGRGAGTSRHRTRFRSALAIAQVSLALILLVGAALLITSVRQLSSVVLGFRPQGAMTMQLSISNAKYTDSHAQQTYIDRVVERLGTIPGVQKAGAVFFLPLGNGFTSGDISVEGRPAAAPGHEQYAGYRIVSGDFLGALGVTVRQGRPLAPTDRSGAPLVTVVKKRGEKPCLGQNPLGSGSPSAHRIPPNGARSSESWLTSARQR